MKFNKKIKILSVITCLSLIGAIGIACIPYDTTLSTKNSEVIKDGQIQPIMTQEEKLNAFTEEGIDKISNVYGDSSYGVDMVGLLGREIPQTELKLLNGETLNTDEFEGKEYVIEVVASWCEYCKETSRDYLTDIINKNTNLGFVQVFAEGDAEAVNEYYEEIGKDPTSLKNVVPASSEASDFVSELNIQSFPTWIFVDSEGKVSWAHSGVLTSNDFSILRNVAFSGDKLYTMLNEDFDSSRAGITINDIYDSLSSDAISQILSVESENSYMVLANLAREFNNFKATDINGKEFDISSLEGEKIIIDIEVANDSFTNVLENSQNASELAEYAKENDITTVQVWLAYYENGELVTGSKYREENGIDTPYDYTIDADETQSLEDIYQIDIYNAPSQIYLNEEGIIVGATTGKMSVERLAAAIDLYFGETPLYEMVNEELEASMNSNDIKVIQNIAIAVLIVITLVGSGFIAFEVRKNKNIETSETLTNEEIKKEENDQ